MHDILIGGLIAIIVFVQFYVAYTTSKKIKLFKIVIPEANNFDIVKVYIPENQIKTIKTDYILDNLKTFTKTPNSNNFLEVNQVEVKNSEQQDFVIKAETGKQVKDLINQQTKLHYQEELEISTAFEEIDAENYSNKQTVWVSKDLVEKKVLRKKLSAYQEMGWSEVIE